MALEIPNLSGTHIIKLYIACYVTSPPEQLKEWLRQVGNRHQAKVHSNWWLHDFYFVFPMQEDGEEMLCAILTLDQIRAHDNLDPEKSIDVLEERFSHLYGIGVSCRIMATLRVPLDRIPKNGRIDAILGVTTELDKVKLEYTGAKTRVHGSIFTDFNWELVAPGPKTGSAAMIESTLDAWVWNYAAADDSLSRALPLVMKAIDCFVFDKPCDDSICKSQDSGGK